ncbi:MAG TPA: HD domain-containing protein [Fimbriimonas sp.]|nr:HD domain-containing protein [Fimbriimonas sp.]
MLTRQQAFDLVTEHTKNPALVKHMRIVEACVRWYAEQLGEDVETWGRAGLLHDFDYDAHPDEHPRWGISLLESMGEDPVVIQAIAAHASERTGVSPTSLLDKHLFACDELSGLINACILVRPSRSVMDLEVKSVKKKLKDPTFAAGVNRSDVAEGVELIGIDLDQHISNLLTALRGKAIELGIAGEAVS